MKIALQVNGQERLFTVEELSAIVEEHFSSDSGSTEVRTYKPPFFKRKGTPVEGEPIEGQWFEVNPQAIDRNLFWDRNPEEVVGYVPCYVKGEKRVKAIIRRAFKELDKNPERYGRPFQTLDPARNGFHSVDELWDYAAKIGDHNADWVELALQWAQQITNGVPWTTLCDRADTADFYRLVRGPEDCTLVVGGSSERCGSWGRPPAACFSRMKIPTWGKGSTELHFATCLAVRY